MPDVPARERKTPDCVTGDGIICPKQSPWPKWVRWVTTLPILPMTALGIYILARTDTVKLIIWLTVLAVFAVPLRYLVCARCPYYGQPCSTTMGKIVPLLFNKQDGKPMKFGLWLDVISFTLLFLLPIPEAYELGGMILAVVWAGVLLLFFLLLSHFACTVCPLTFCPIGKCGKAFWRMLGKKTYERSAAEETD